MANTKSAKKKVRGDSKKTAANKRYMRTVEYVMKKESDVSKAYKAIDKASKKGVITKQKAARLKSQVAKKK